MKFGQRQFVWRVLGSLGLLFAALLSLFSGPQGALADTGVNISNMTKTTGQALGIDPAGTKICTVWTQFDVDSPQVYFRLYEIASQTWTPALGAAPEQVSTVGGVSKMRCTIDTNGNAHVAWQQGGGEVKHRYRAPNGDWSSIASFGGSKPDLDADSSGKVWMVTRLWGGDGGSSTLAFRSWTQGGGWGSAQDFNTGGDGDDPRIGTDNIGNAHVIFRNGGAGGVSYVGLKADNSFTSRVSVPNGGTGAIHSDIAVDRNDGTVYSIFVRDWTHVHFARKGINDATFPFSKEAANGTNSVDNTTIAWSPGGQLFVGFNNNNGSYVGGIKSTDNGQNWTGIVPVTDPGGKVANPMVVADPNGGGYAVYNNSNASASVYFILSGSTGIPPAERCAGFADVRNNTPACPAITALSQSGVITGYATTPPTFGPADPVQRAQMAAFLVRGLQWQGMPQSPNTFSDFGQLVGELREASLILANACTNTSDPNTCVAKGYGDGRFGPNDTVTYAQVISFIARAFVYDGTWAAQSSAHPYSGVPAVHENDVRTYHAYAGLITNVPMPSTPEGWNQPAPRAWVAVVLYQALQTQPQP